MRKLFYIFIFVFLVNCSKSKEINDVNLEKTEAVMPAESFEYETILQQKLQDYYDLISLKENYPNFNQEVNEQLSNLVKDTVNVSANETVTIKNLNLVKEVQLNDSVKEVKLHFDIITNNSSKRDSLIAIIKTKQVIIDGYESIATKIKFKKE